MATDQRSMVKWGRGGAGLSFRCVLFDFDFTLADSSDPITRCVRHALATVDGPAPTDHEILRTVGLALPEMFHRLAPGCDHDRLAALFSEKAEEIMVEGTKVYNEVPEVLDSFKAAGVMTGIVSTKLRRRIERILADSGLLPAFDVIVGAEDVTRHKPHPDALLRAMSALGVGRREVLYVGDSLVDAETAQRAGVLFCAVLHGMTCPEEFRPYSPISVVSDLREIVPVLTMQSA